MRFMILGLLLVGPRSLYELHARFESGLSYVYAASYGSIHRALHRLHDAGDVELVETVDTARGTKRYRATGQGRRTWLAWMRQPQAGEDHEASMLARVFLLGLLDGPGDRREVLVALRRRAHQDLDGLRSIDPGDDGGVAARYPRAALDHGLRSGAQTVAWLDELLDELPEGEGR